MARHRAAVRAGGGAAYYFEFWEHRRRVEESAYTVGPGAVSMAFSSIMSRTHYLSPASRLSIFMAGTMPRKC